MTTPKQSLTQEELREYLRYDPDIGKWFWIKRRSKYSNILVGDENGTLHQSGYVTVGLFGKMYSSHRLAWFYMTGNWPNSDIDHINHVRSDNRWCNLRITTDSLNAANRVRRNNRRIDLPKGVYQTPYGYLARYCKDRKSYVLGTFKTIEQASNAYNTELAKSFGAYAYTGSMRSSDIITTN